jgi:hypothetical protein
MTKRMLPGLILALLVVLSSCNPFTTNLYSSFDKFKNPDLSDANELLDASDEPQFYENLKDDPDAKAQVLDTLQDVLDDADASDTKKQEAALMMMDVHLKTSETEETLTSMNSLIVDAMSGEVDLESAGSGPEAIFRTIFGEPPSPYSSTYKALVVMQLTAFNEAAAPLEAYGDIIQVTGQSPPGTNDGDNATKALMAGMTRTLVHYIDAGTKAAKINILAEYLSTPKDPDGTVPYTITYDDPLNALDAIEGPSDMLLNPDTGGDGLVTVVELAIDLDSFL